MSVRSQQNKREGKRRAIEEFTQHLLESPVGGDIARIVLFGSVAKGTEREDSDIDLMVVASDKPEQVKRVCQDLAFEILLTYGEGVEAVVHCLDAWRSPPSHLVWRVRETGEEIYAMKEEEIRRAEARGYLEVAAHYLAAARRNMAAEDFRITADLAYNAAELCAKGFLVLQLEELPSSHRGVVNRFSELYVRDGPLPREWGRGLNSGLSTRNQARYEPHVSLGEKDAQELVRLAEMLMDALEDRLSASGADGSQVSG